MYVSVHFFVSFVPVTEVWVFSEDPKSLVRIISFTSYYTVDYRQIILKPNGKIF
jgi:hypothetical protein